MNTLFSKFKQLLLLSILILFTTQCKKAGKSPNGENHPQNEVILPSNLIEVSIDNQYHFDGASAYSLDDSAVVKDGKFRISKPSRAVNQIILINKKANVLLAVVNVVSVENTFSITADQVSRSLLDLVPLFNSMSVLEKSDFLNSEFLSTNEFKTFKEEINKSMVGGTELLNPSNDPFMKSIIGIHSYIKINHQSPKQGYIMSPKVKSREWKSSTVATLKSSNHIPGVSVLITGPTVTGFNTILDDWIDPNHVIKNPLSTFAQLFLQPITNFPPPPILKLIEPTAGPIMNDIPDGYYSLAIIQSDSVSLKKNADIVAKAISEYAIGNILSTYSPDIEKNCFTDVVSDALKAVTAKIVSITASKRGRNFVVDDVVKEIVLASFQIYKSIAAINGNCQPAMVKLIEKRSNIMVNIINQIYLKYETLNSIIKIYAPVQSLVLPEFLGANIQIYNAKVIKGCLTLVKEELPNSSYNPGEKLSPSISITALESFGEWEKMGFKVDWILEKDNGSLNLTESSTNAQGKATTEWSLPMLVTGSYTLKAQVLDREKEHIRGSPIIFKVN